MEVTPDAHAVYNAKQIILMPGESYMAVTLEMMFPDTIVPIEVRKAVKHLGEVLNNINSSQLQFETSVTHTQLLALKTRYTLMSWRLAQ